MGAAISSYRVEGLNLTLNDKGGIDLSIALDHKNTGGGRNHDLSTAPLADIEELIKDSMQAKHVSNDRKKITKTELDLHFQKVRILDNNIEALNPYNPRVLSMPAPGHEGQVITIARDVLQEKDSPDKSGKITYIPMNTKISFEKGVVHYLDFPKQVTLFESLPGVLQKDTPVEVLG
jgi:hypothetical protein